MKCPICGAPTEVKDTRPHKKGYIQRRRVCFNLHRFQTYEVLAAQLAQPPRRQTPN